MHEMLPPVPMTWTIGLAMLPLTPIKLVRFDVRGLDRFRPLRDLALREREEFPRRAAGDFGALLLELDLHIAHLQQLPDVVVQLVDDRRRHARRRDDAVPR